jgi:hypothetical protein
MDRHTAVRSLQDITKLYEEVHTMAMHTVIDGFSINRRDGNTYEGQTRNGRNDDAK